MMEDAAVKINKFIENDRRSRSDTCINKEIK